MKMSRAMRTLRHVSPIRPRHPDRSRRRRDKNRSRRNWILRGRRGRNPRAMLLNRCAGLLRRTRRQTCALKGLAGRLRLLALKCRRGWRRLPALKGLAGRWTCRRKSAGASSRRRSAAKSLTLSDACRQQQKHPGREWCNGFHNASQCQGNHKKAGQGKSTAACQPLTRTATRTNIGQDKKQRRVNSDLAGSDRDRKDQLDLLTNIASSARMKPGGLPCFERISSHPALEPTTVICVPLVICATTRAELPGSS